MAIQARCAKIRQTTTAMRMSARRAKTPVACRPGLIEPPAGGRWFSHSLWRLVRLALSFHFPPLDRSANALKPEHSEAQAALDEMTAAVGIPQDPLWVIISGHREPEVFEVLSQAGGILQRAVSNRTIGGYLLPTVMWPRVEYQQANRAQPRRRTAGPYGADAAVQGGFETNALFLTDELLRTWARAGNCRDVFWPTNDMSQWLLKRFVARSGDVWFVMGLVYPATNAVSRTALAELSSRLEEKNVLLSSWGSLGGATLERVQSRMGLVMTPMVALVLGSLWLAFRRLTEVLFGLAVLLLSGLCLLVTMSLAGWSWNLLNLMAVPLIFGHRHRLQHFHATGFAAARRRPRSGSPFHWTRSSVVRWNRHRRVWSLAWSGNSGIASWARSARPVSPQIC